MRVWHTALGSALLVFSLAPPLQAGDLDAQALDRALGAAGRSLSGGVRRYGWPRRDLAVTLGGVKLEPALALGSWGAFLPAAQDGEAMTMGDLVLLESEVAPVVASLQAGGLDVLAIHNHLVGERPPVVYVHFGGHGDPAALGRGLKAALGKTKTPSGPSAPREPTAPEKALFTRLEKALGHSGAPAGRVLQVSVPRAGKIEEHGLEIPPSMGMGTAMNFQPVGEKLATTGDFVLVASEVNPVIAALVANGLQATALHSHMLEETPRLFFLHFWGLDTPERIGAALAAALAKVDVKK